MHQDVQNLILTFTSGDKPFNGAGSAALHGPDTEPEIRQLLENALADMKRQGAEIVDGVNIPEIDLIPPSRLFCNRFKFDIEAYLASLGPQAPVKNLGEILASQKFHPSIEKRMLDAQAEPPPDRNPSCVAAEESGRRLAMVGDGSQILEGSR
jgi:Asp-tRNA(Asn)/Glu-tRNA(Gln) amidotransferase A subunit family amidase